MNHFSVIGFNASDKEKFNQLVQSLIPISKKTRYGKYNLYTFTDDSGAQVYINTKPNWLGKDTLDSITPAFNGKVLQTIRMPDHIYKRETFVQNVDWPLEVSLYTWVYSDEDSMEYPLIVDIPNFLELRGKDVNAAEVIQATLFPSNFEHFKEEDEFWKKYPKKDGVGIPAPGMFIPTGTFSSTNDPSFKPSAQCWCYGKVRSVEILKNKLSGLEFRHLVINTCAANYDLLIDDSYKDEIKEGDIVGGTFWVCGKLIVK